MYKMPALETVAGVAVLKFDISNNNRMAGVNAIRSLLARVSTWKLYGLTFPRLLRQRRIFLGNVPKMTFTTFETLANILHGNQAQGSINSAAALQSKKTGL